MKFSIIFPIKNQTGMFIKNLKEKVIPYFESCGHVFDIIVEADAMIVAAEIPATGNVALLDELPPKNMTELADWL